ncbi:hypothetical protein [Paraburkholderia aromaticivorans]|uniref:hypothetical protein n=1 Tax=Paraburkholderia aromaticivorans TaxID=2026199 RepID=UPI00197E5BF1|nr:hypothetical protein [Paraburkholderia aromaticivorans]
MGNQVKRKSFTPAQIETAYLLELSVGTSHVISMLYPASRQACVEELSENFLTRYGNIHLKGFLLALAEKLDARANSEGATAVRHYALFGATPPKTLLISASAAVKKKRMRRAAPKYSQPL